MSIFDSQNDLTVPPSEAASSTIYVIVSLYNKAEYVGRTIASMLRQSLECWVGIIVDDGSTDESTRIVKEMVQQDPRFQIVSQENSGPAYARQAGLRLVPQNAEFIMFLDADDILEDNALELLRGALTEHPKAVGAVGRTCFIDEHDVDITEANQWRTYEKYVSAEDHYCNADFLVQGPITSPGQVLVRYQAYKAVGGFADNISGVEDWDLWYRMTCSGATLVRVKDFTFRYRVMQGSLSKRIAGMRASSLLMHRRWYRSASTPLSRSRIVDGYTKHAVAAVPRILSQLWTATRTRQFRLILVNLQRIAIACIRSQNWFTRILLSR